MATKEEILNTFTSEEGAWFAYKEGIQIGYNEAFNSLRNQAAISILQGIISNEGYTTDHRMKSFTRKQQVEAAVNYANLLVEELKK